MPDELRCAVEPRSIAIVGASEDPDKIGGRCLYYLKRFGFRGAIFPVNPARSQTQGVATYRSIDALPEVAELAIIAVPGEHAVEAVEACALHGTRVAVILAAGFGETGEAGREQERRMLRAARAAGMRLIGPNAQGLANFRNGAIATHSTMLIESAPEDGPVAIVSQSGGGASVVFGLLRERGVGVRYYNAVGNQCDVTVSELALAAARDPEIRLLLLYFEGIPEPCHLAELGAVARERDLPVLVLKAGRTAAGRKASFSHTGSLATEDRVVDAFLEYHGLTRAKGVEDLVRAAEIYVKGWKPGGRRLAVISHSGTACVLAADAASEAGLPIIELQAATRAELGKVLPPFASTANPVDMTAVLMSNSGMFGETLRIIARDGGADVYLISVPVAGRGYDVDSFARDAAILAETTALPVVVVAPQPQVARKFRDVGLPVFPFESDGVAALHQFICAHENLRNAREARGDSPTAPIAPAQPAAREQVLNEADGLALVQAHGIATVEHRLCHSEHEVVEALAVVGGLAAIKGCTSGVTHKSDVGLVCLDVASEDQARRAWSDIHAAAARHGVTLDAIIVARMSAGRREMIVGAHRDPTFGPVLTVGDGGKYVEQLPDAQVLMANATRGEILRAIDRLRIAPVLKGVRGEAPMDIDALCTTLLALGGLMRSDAALESVDLNPVVLRDAGEGCLALDAVVIRRCLDEH